MDDKTVKYDVFISYRHETGFYMAQLLFERFTNDGFRVFMDKSLKHEKYEPQLESAVKNSKIFILVLFPGDLDLKEGKNKAEWLEKEIGWALEVGVKTRILPVLCNGFDVNAVNNPLSPALIEALKIHGISVRNDSSFDTTINNLCEIVNEEAVPLRSEISTRQYLDEYLGSDNIDVISFDMAFLSGKAWFNISKKKPDLIKLLENGIPTRVVINTPEVAESIAMHMRDEDADDDFDGVISKWRKYSDKYPGVLQVRLCEIPLCHVFHNIKIRDRKTGSVENRMQVRYYIYKNAVVNKSLQQQIRENTDQYKAFETEFEYLWEQSKPL